MEKESYHHGNLRQELIQAGIRIIDEEGYEHLSLRKAAALCGVSHAAPKNHFADKEEFTEAIKKYVSDEFAGYMEKVVKEAAEERYVIRDMGRAYIRFFADHPHCYGLIIGQKDIEIRASAEKIEDSTYRPFQIFQENASRIFRNMKMPEQEIPKLIISSWAIVNGLAGLQEMKGFHYEGDWTEMVNRIIGGKSEK